MNSQKAIKGFVIGFGKGNQCALVSLLSDDGGVPGQYIEVWPTEHRKPVVDETHRGFWFGEKTPPDRAVKMYDEVYLDPNGDLTVANAWFYADDRLNLKVPPANPSRREVTPAAAKPVVVKPQAVPQQDTAAVAPKGKKTSKYAVKRQKLARELGVSLQTLTIAGLGEINDAGREQGERDGSPRVLAAA